MTRIEDIDDPTPEQLFQKRLRAYARERPASRPSTEPVFAFGGTCNCQHALNHELPHQPGCPGYRQLPEMGTEHQPSSGACICTSEHERDSLLPHDPKCPKYEERLRFLEHEAAIWKRTAESEQDFRRATAEENAHLRARLEQMTKRPPRVEAAEKVQTSIQGDLDIIRNALSWSYEREDVHGAYHRLRAILPYMEDQKPLVKSEGVLDAIGTEKTLDQKCARAEERMAARAADRDAAHKKAVEYMEYYGLMCRLWALSVLEYDDAKMARVTAMAST